MPDFAVRTAFRATDRISPAFRQMGNASERFGTRATRSFGRVNRAGVRMRTIMGGIVGAMGITGGLNLIRQGIAGIVGEAARLENAVADFTTLTGSVENARSTVQDLQTLGAATPFEFGDLSRASTTLLGFEAVTRQNLVPTLRMLGDVSGGNADRLNRITLAFSQIRAGGRASMQDINQLINAGVPILGELGRMWGVTVGQARQMISTGRATGDAVTEAFRRMTAEGGRFHGGMERASRTLTGRFSTFIDNVKVAAAAIGTALLPQLKAALDYFIGLAESIGRWATENKDAIKSVFGTIGSALKFVLKILPYVVAGFLAYKAVLIAITIVQGAMVAAGWIRYLIQMAPLIMRSVRALGFFQAMLKGTAAWETILAIKSGIMTAAQWLFNTALFGCPIVWIIAAIIALIAAIVLLVRNWDTVKAKILMVWEAIKEKVQMVVGYLTGLFERFGDAGFMDVMIAPINLLISQLRLLFTIAARIPRIGQYFQRAADSIGEYQSAANQAMGTRNLFAPNQAQQGQQVRLQGEININNAPPGSTARVTRGAEEISMIMMGVNP